MKKITEWFLIQILHNKGNLYTEMFITLYADFSATTIFSCNYSPFLFVPGKMFSQLNKRTMSSIIYSLFTQ